MNTNESAESGPGNKGPDSQRVYTTREIAFCCKVSANTVGRWFTEGKIPYFKTAGGRRRAWGKDVIALMESLNMPVPSELRAPEPVKILIVDDEETVRAVIKRLIKQAFPAVELEEAVDGFDAGQKLALMAPSVVILDIFMPGLNGLDLCRRIRADENYRSVKILAISGHEVETTKEEALDAGADAFYPKPIAAEAFLCQLEELFLPAVRK